MNSGPQHLVILVRHASRERRWSLPESTHWMKDWSKVYFPQESDPNAEGLRLTSALAGRLCDELMILAGEQNKEIIVTDIVHSGHTVARQTAGVYLTVLKERSKHERAPMSFKAEVTLGDLEEGKWKRRGLTPETFSLKDVIDEIEAFKKRNEIEAFKRKKHTRNRPWLSWSLAINPSSPRSPGKC